MSALTPSAPAKGVAASSRGILDAIGSIEVGALALATPLLIFPSRFSILGLLLVALCWELRVIAAPHTLVRAPTDWPLVGLLLMASISLYPSIDLRLSLPKLYGLLLGLTYLLVIIRHVRAPRNLAVLAAVMVIGGVVVSAIGLVGSDWLTSKVTFLADVYSHMPRFIHSVQTSQGTVAGIQPNEVAGTLTLLLPVSSALVLSLNRFWWRLGLALASGLMAMTLVLTFSRSALFGTAIGAALFAIAWWPRLRLPAVALLALVGVGVWRLGITAATSLLVDAPTGGDLAGKVVSRQEIWDRALTMVQDYPFTGIGLNTFPVVLTRLYPTFVNYPPQLIPHAHDLLLQTAVDFGIPGLGCFVAVLAIAGRSLLVAWQQATGWRRGLVGGLAAGLTAHLLFGLTDAVALGAKAGIFLWIDLGAAVALAATGPVLSPATSVERGRRLIDYATGFVLAAALGLGTIIAIDNLTSLP